MLLSYRDLFYIGILYSEHTERQGQDRERQREIVSWRFKPSQPQRIGQRDKYSETEIKTDRDGDAYTALKKTAGSRTLRQCVVT